MFESPYSQRVIHNSINLLLLLHLRKSTLRMHQIEKQTCHHALIESSVKIVFHTLVTEIPEALQVLEVPADRLVDVEPVRNEARTIVAGIIDVVVIEDFRGDVALLKMVIDLQIKHLILLYSLILKTEIILLQKRTPIEFIAEKAIPVRDKQDPIQIVVP